MKRGRKKDPTKAKNRRVTVVLTELAYDVYKNQCSLRSKMGRKLPGHWIHQFVSEKIIDKYGEGKRSILLQEMNLAYDEAQKAQDKYELSAKRYSAYKNRYKTTQTRLDNETKKTERK